MKKEEKIKYIVGLGFCDFIFKKLVRDTGRTSFTLEDISYWVEPAFENTDIKQWNIENKK